MSERREIILCATAIQEVETFLSAAAKAYSGADLELVFVPSANEALRRARGLNDANASIVACIADCSLSDTAGKELLYALQPIAPRAAAALVAAPDEFDEAIQAVKDERADRVISLAGLSESECGCHIRALLAHSAHLDELHSRLKSFEGKHLFVTGATGFLGTRFLRDVLRCTDVRVTALTRPRKGVSHDQRLPFGEDEFPGRLRFVEGDVREADLGIQANELAPLRDSLDEVWHLAALTTFDEIMRDATFAVNLAGTVNTLEFARGVTNLQCFNHVSTAYVCGADEYASAISEELGPRPACFRNPYEESKYLAEQEVAKSGLPHLIYRPSIILGETVSGRCDGQTVYNIAKMVRLAKLLGEMDCMDRGLPLDYHSFRVVANTESRKNIITVDQAIAMMLMIRASEPKLGSLFHITHSCPVAIGDLVETIAELLEASHYEIVDSLEDEDLSVPEVALERVAQIFRPYMVASDPVFDTSRTQEALGSYEQMPISKEQLLFSMDAFYTQYFGVGYKETAVRA